VVVGFVGREVCVPTESGVFGGGGGGGGGGIVQPVFAVS